MGPTPPKEKKATQPKTKKPKTHTTPDFFENSWLVVKKVNLKCFSKCLKTLKNSTSLKKKSSNEAILVSEAVRLGLTRSEPK